MSSLVRSVEVSTVAFLGPFAKLRKVAISFVMSVCLSALNNSAPTARIFMKFDVGVFFAKLRENSRLIKTGQL